MILTKGRAQRSHDVLQPDLVGRDHVGVTLDHRHPARLRGPQLRARSAP